MDTPHTLSTAFRLEETQEEFKGSLQGQGSSWLGIL